MGTTESTDQVPVSVQCVDNADGFPGVIVWENSTFPRSSQQDAIEETSSAEEWDSSSVRPFQRPQYDTERHSMDSVQQRL